MNPNETRTLWISIGSALFAVFLIYSYTQEKRAQLDDQFGTKKNVVVAAKDILEMQTIDESMLKIIERPVDFIGPHAVTDPENAVGLVALAPIKSGEEILETKIMEPGPVTGLALQVSPGKRAVTIPVDEMRAVGKLLKPGDHVDLVAALDVGTGNNRRREIKTILQDVPVLATGVRIVNELPRILKKSGDAEVYENLREDTSYTTITVETTPTLAQDLVYILSTSPGSLFLTLRHPSDRKKETTLQTANIGTVLREVPPAIMTRQIQPRMPASPPPPPPAQAKPKQTGPYRDI